MKSYNDIKTKLFFCENCGTATLLINKSEAELLSKYIDDDDLLIEEYDIPIITRTVTEKDYKVSALGNVNYKDKVVERKYLGKTLEEDMIKIYEKYSSLITSGVIKLKQKFRKKDGDTVHITYEYLLNKEIGVNYMIESYDLLEKIGQANELKKYSYQSLLKQINMAENELDEYTKRDIDIIKKDIRIEKEMKCQLCSLSNIIQINLDKGYIKYIDDTGDRIVINTDENIKKIIALKDEFIEKNKNIELEKIKNKIESQLRDQKVVNKKISVQDVLLALINSEKNIKILISELEKLVEKKEIQKNLIICKLCEIKDKKIIKQERELEEPSKPKVPIEPKYVKVGWFTKRSDQEYNLTLSKEYEKQLNIYEKKLKNYNIKMKEIENKKKKNYELINDEFKKIISYQDNPINIIENVKGQFLKQDQKKLEEIAFLYIELDKKAKETEMLLAEWQEIKEKLISLKIIFPKYNNLVAWTTMSEYFSTGRVDCLEGTDGAYNLYESESRANIIITKLDAITDKLEEIKNNQYILYEVMNDISEYEKQINEKMNIELTLSALTAYNTERIARYSKINSELATAKLLLN